MATSYGIIQNTTLSVVLSTLEEYKISADRIVNVYHDGTNHIAVYVING